MLLKFANLKISRTFAVYLITQVHLFFGILVQQNTNF